MGKIKDKIEGKAKQIVGEVTGDGKLAREGKEQDKKADTQPMAKPFGNLDKLT
jgi:uncharacterized protein YjbJ (UPF0337 family)